MTRNLGSVDRIVRLTLAVAALVAAVVLGTGSVAGVVVLALGAVLLVTAAAGFCPLYRILGIDTCPMSRR